MTRFRTLSLTTIVSTILCASFVLAQDPPKDDALDNLLKKLEGAKSSDTAKPQPNAKGAPADTSKPPASKKADDLETKDKALDNLLEKLGESPDTPSPDDRPKGPGGQRPEPPKNQQGQGKTKNDQLKGGAKDLDEHLEELTGRKRKRKNEEQQGEGSGPLSKVVKEMRDVEQRLGKTDTGEETRKKQTEIVKNLETLIEELKKSQSQSQAKRKRMLSMKPGGQPNGKSEPNNGANAKGVGLQKPEKPPTKHSLTGGKDEWGHLPEALRMEMENVFKEEGLPKMNELIRRYYLSLSKKMLVREE